MEKVAEPKMDLITKLWTAHLRQDGQVLYECLEALSRVVFQRHFYYAEHLREDLVSEGVVKGLSLLPLGQENQNLKSFLYTGMRNQMTNFLYRIKEDVGVIGDSSVGGSSIGGSSGDEDCMTYCFRYCQIEGYIGAYLLSRYRGYMYHVISLLGQIGITVYDVPREILQLREEPNWQTIRRMLCIILSKIRESQASYPD